MKPPGMAKALIDRIAHHEVVELVLALLGVARERVAELLNVVGDLGVLEHEALGAHLSRPGLAHLVLLLEGNRGGRGAAEIGQFLFLLWGRRTRRPAHAHARAPPQQRRRDENSQ